jgi:hypothetical protein
MTAVELHDHEGEVGAVLVPEVVEEGVVALG